VLNELVLTLDGEHVEVILNIGLGFRHDKKNIHKKQHSYINLQLDLNWSIV